MLIFLLILYIFVFKLLINFANFLELCLQLDVASSDVDRSDAKHRRAELFRLLATMFERMQWLKCTRRPDGWIAPSLCYVCSEHFLDGRPTRSNPFPIPNPVQIKSKAPAETGSRSETGSLLSLVIEFSFSDFDDLDYATTSALPVAEKRTQGFIRKRRRRSLNSLNLVSAKRWREILYKSKSFFFFDDVFYVKAKCFFFLQSEKCRTKEASFFVAKYFARR